MKVAFKKLHQFSLFGLKIFEWKTDYVERSRDADDDEDDLFMQIVDKTIKDGES